MTVVEIQAKATYAYVEGSLSANKFHSKQPEYVGLLFLTRVVMVCEWPGILDRPYVLGTKRICALIAHSELNS